MKKRYIYFKLFGVPGFLVSLIVAFIIFGFVAGFFWLYVYGDEPWPASAEQLLTILVVACFLALWAISLVIGFVTRNKKDPVAA